MRHGFSRFGLPSARERFHKQSHRGGSWTILLPTITATLFLFTLVVVLNKTTALTRGGKIVRLLSVEEVFPSQDVEQHKKKEFWEQPTPPSPDWLLEVEEGLETPVLEEPGPGADFPSVPATRASSRSLMIEISEIEAPFVSPNTDLPVPPTP